MSKNLQETSPFYKGLRPFIIGGLSGCSATCCIQPIDMVKVRIQLQGEGTGKGVNANPFKIGLQIIKEDGFLSLYKGLSAALLRQLTYGTARLGIFRTLTNYLTSDNNNNNSSFKYKSAADIPLHIKTACSLTAGGLGALIGTPPDAALVRMQSDATLPINKRRGYNNAFNALFRMYKEEGLKGFFSGASPTVIRGLVMNVGMLTTYDSFKQWFGPYFGGEESQSTRFFCGALSGWTAATLSLPADFIKTRLQKQTKLEDGSYPYRGFWHCTTQTVKNEGILALYQGYLTFVVRITPHIMLTWVFMDNYEVMFNKCGV